LLLGFGSQVQKVEAAYYLGFYALLRGLPFIYASIVLSFLGYGVVHLDFEVRAPLLYILSLGFLIKFPIYFFHLWLPKVHVESPTSASVLLAGLLLKLGVFGFFRFLSGFYSSRWLFLSRVSLLGILLGGLVCCLFSDSKTLAAYSSISHIGFALLFLMGGRLFLKWGSLLIMVRHGYISSLMFYFIGVLYNFFSTRLVYLLGGL